MNAILLMYCMQSNEMDDMSDSMIAVAAGRNVAIFVTLTESLPFQIFCLVARLVIVTILERDFQTFRK